MDEKPHGYNVRDTIVYNKDGHTVKQRDLAALQCPLCELVLRDPVQVITCGHRFCRGCLALKTSASIGPLKCPIGGEVFEPNQIRNDKGCFKEIKDLLVDCPTKPLPCPWRGPLMEIEEHSDVCPKTELACSFGCGAKFPRSDAESHAAECRKRPINCDYCGNSVPRDDIEDHYNKSCKFCPVSCDFCKKNLSSRKKLESHLEDECAEYVMTCPNKKLGGCTHKGKKSQMLQHVLEYHMMQSVEKTSILEQKLAEMYEENQRLHARVATQDQSIKKLEERFLAMEKSVSFGAERMPDMIEADGPKKSSASRPLVRNGSTQSRRDSDDEIDLDRRRPPKKTNAASRSLVVLGSAQFRGGSDDEKDSGVQESINMTVSKLREEVSAERSQLLRVVENVQSVQEAITRHSIAVDELRLRQDVLDVKTTNGVLIWKIPEIRRRYRDAVARRTISLYSPPFYTSPHGYRMCLRVYLNGDGAGKGTHISVFLVLMRSEHDNLLTWPFKQPVKFTLINQANPEESTSEMFVPDLQSPSFQKPDSEMNIASGFPRFAKQSFLNDKNFSQDDAIFIKAQVDLAGL